MKRTILFILACAFSAGVFSQQRTDVRSDRVIADIGLYLKDRWIDSIKNDTINLSNNATRTLMTTQAIIDYSKKFGAGVVNGNKADINVADDVWTINAGAVTDAKISSGIDASKISSGSVNNTTFNYISTLSSNAQTQIDGKQATLISGANIKTVNGVSLLGSGNISISGGGGSGGGAFIDNF